MRILFINPLQARHGSTYRARNLLRLLSAKNQVLFVESREDPGKDNGSGALQAAGLLRSAWGFLGKSLHGRFDLLFLQKPMVLAFPALVAARLKRKPVVIDFDDLDSGWQTTAWKRCLALIGERYMPRYAEMVTTHNRYLKEHLAERWGDKIRLIPQGVDTALFDPGRFDRDLERRRLGLDGKQVFTFLGSFTKGSAADLDVILEAWKAVSEVHDEAFLMILGGGGPLESHYLAMIRDLGLKNVFVTGRKEQAEVPRYLCCADYGLVFMRDNRANRFRMSLKVLEYLAMGLSVIGHLVGGTKDAFEAHCHTCRPTARSLGATMLEVLGAGARKGTPRGFIVENYDWKRFAPLLDGVIDACSAERLS